MTNICGYVIRVNANLFLYAVKADVRFHVYRLFEVRRNGKKTNKTFIGYSIKFTEIKACLQSIGSTLFFKVYL